MSTPKEVMEKLLNEHANDAKMQERIKGWDKVFQFKPSDAAAFYLEIKDGKAQIKEGTSPNASATFIMKSNDMIDLLGGKLNPVSAFMSGKLRIEGNIFEAQMLQSLLG
jgi:putative sterol carrier protein